MAIPRWQAMQSGPPVSLVLSPWEAFSFTPPHPDRFEPLPSRYALGGASDTSDNGPTPPPTTTTPPWSLSVATCLCSAPLADCPAGGCHIWGPLSTPNPPADQWFSPRDPRLINSLLASSAPCPPAPLLPLTLSTLCPTLKC